MPRSPTSVQRERCGHSQHRGPVFTELLPEYVASAIFEGDDAQAEWRAQETLGLERAVESRRLEFATARACARRALRALGLPASTIPRGAHREPLWPQGVIGSITHCQGFRAAAVARARDLRALGIDAELDEPLPRDILEHIAGAQERTALQGLPRSLNADRLLFSAKEAIYKAWYPLTHQPLGFEEVRLRLLPDQGAFAAQLLHPSAAAVAAATLQGRFLVRAGRVLTAVVLPH